MLAQVCRYFKTGTMYIILNGIEGLTGCGLHGYRLVSVLLQRVNPILLFFLNNSFLLLFQVSLVCLFCCF